MITLLFSSHNGSSTLPAMLEQLATIHRPQDLRIVAVDNGSSDGTGELLRHWTRRLPMQVWRLPAATTARPLASKNRALNFALDQLAPSLAASELVVVSDDDVIPSPDWLTAFLGAADANPGADVFGGRIVPRWLAPPPAWLDSLQDCFPILFATTSATDGACSSHDVYGPNMAVRGRLFAQGMRFDPRIGPNGTARFGMGSESELLRRLERGGHRFVFCEAALVEHQVKPALLELAAVLQRGWRYGFGRAMMDGQQRSRPEMVAAALRDRVLREAKAAAARLPCFADRRTKLLFWREVARGYLEGTLQAPLRESSVSGSSGGRNAFAAPGSHHRGAQPARQPPYRAAPALPAVARRTTRPS